MGANAKRKAARALKFGYTVNDSTATATAQTREAEDAKPTSSPASGDIDVESSEESGEEFEGCPPDEDEQGKKDSESGRSGTRTGRAAPQRFICFVGNLPFSATEAALKQRFASVKPMAVRLRTDKATGRCRGFAFMEFDSKDNLQACLRRFHHAHFPERPSAGDGEAAPAATAEGADGEPVHQAKPGRGWRRINVELTVGGGGHQSKGRKVRLQAKNDRLNKQRKRRAAALAEKHGTEAAAGKGAGGGGGGTAQEATPNDAGNVHPSRMSRVKA